MTARSETFEEIGNGSLVTTANSGFDAVGGTGMTVDQTHVYQGSNACMIATATSGTGWGGYLSASPQATATFDDVFYFTAFPSAIVDLHAALLNSTTTFRYRTRLLTTGHLAIIDSTGTNVIATTATIPLNQWFRVESLVTSLSASTGAASINLYNTPTTVTPTETKSVTSQNFGGTADLRRHGFCNGGVIGAFWTDTVLDNDTGTTMGVPAGGATAAVTFSGAGTGGTSSTAVASATVSFSGAATGAAVASASAVIDLTSGASATFNRNASASSGLTFSGSAFGYGINPTDPNAIYTFEPPYIDYGWPTGNRLFDRIQIHRGICVVTDGAGGWQNIEFPWLGLIEDLVDGQDYFLGGHIYAIDADVAASLVAGGYSVPGFTGTVITPPVGPSPGADVYPGPTHFPSSTTFPGSH